jgi:thiol-disulfide isomerase/thioredoxin
VRQDAVRLRGMGAANTLAMKALSRAYQLLGDDDGKKWIVENAPASAPSAAIDVNRAVNTWSRANRPQTAVAPPEFWQKQLRQSAEWIRLWPNEPEPWQRRFEALSQLPDSKPDELAQAASEWIRLHEQRGAESYPPYPLYLSIAAVYAAKDIHPDQVRSLIEKGVKEVLDAVDAPRSDLLPSLDPTGLIGLNSKWNTWYQAADLDIQLRRYAQAHDMLAKLGASMAGEHAGVHEYRYWYAMAMLARAENHLLDALTYERNAIAANARDAAVPASNQEEYTARREKARADRTAEALDMWKALGGSEPAFGEWLNPPVFAAPPPVEKPTTVAQADPWKAIGKPLPDFSVTDAQGKTWRLADLKGKVTLVNLWATWCEPCRRELPYVQKLYDQVSGRADLAVLTLNMDENTGLIAPFMKENGFTFPALPALDYERAFGRGLGLPRTWIVDAEGILVQERLGAGLSDHWLDDMIALMEKARSHR